MRILHRNKTKIWYATVTGSEQEVDEYGDYTGVTVPTYTTPVDIDGNLSASRGTADSELFGIDIQYNRTFAYDDMACPITEDSVIWVYNDPTKEPYDYVVVAIAKSLNNIVYALKEVKTSATPAPEPTPTPDDPADPDDNEDDNENIDG